MAQRSGTGMFPRDGRIPPPALGGGGPAAQRLTLMALGHWTSPVTWHCTEMGRLVADAGERDWDELTAYGAMKGFLKNHFGAGSSLSA